MAEAAFDLLALADAALARRSRVHAPRDREHVNTAPQASVTVQSRPPLSDPSVNTGTASRERVNTVDPLADDFPERAALAEIGAGVPREWAEGYARLQVVRPPAGIAVWRWQQVIDDAGRFLDRWATQAVALGWRTLDVFGVHREKPVERFDAAGLVWLLRGAEVVAITEMMAKLKTTSGATQTYARRDPEHPEAVAVWELSEARP